jgi:hypothetical protein
VNVRFTLLVQKFGSGQPAQKTTKHMAAIVAQWNAGRRLAIHPLWRSQTFASKHTSICNRKPQDEAKPTGL